jgi:hypothetical protein
MDKIALIVAMIFCCQFGHTQAAFVPAFSTILKSDKGKAIMAQCSRSIPEGVTGYFDLSDVDVAKLDSNFKKVLYVKSDGCCIIGGTVMSLDKYAYQFIGVLKGKEKYIYVNAFFIDPKNGPGDSNKGWQNMPILACDGGTGFWGAMFKLSDGTFSELAINGLARP